MKDYSIILYFLSSFTGFIMVSGGIFLLYKEKIYIDSQTKEITALDTPIGKFQTNTPALALFIIGFIPLIYPIWQSSKNASELQHIKSEECRNKKVQVKGKFFNGSSGKSKNVDVYLVVDHKKITVESEVAYHFLAPACDGYQVFYTIGNGILIPGPQAEECGETKNYIELKPPVRLQNNDSNEPVYAKNKIAENTDRFN